MLKQLLHSSALQVMKFGIVMLSGSQCTLIHFVSNSSSDRK